MPLSTVCEMIGKDKSQGNDLPNSHGRHLDNFDRWRLEALSSLTTNLCSIFSPLLDFVL